MVRRPYRRSVKGWEAIPGLQEGSGGPTGSSGGVWRPSWRFGRGWEWMGGPPGGPNGVRRSGRGQEDIPKVQEGSIDPLEGLAGVWVTLPEVQKRSGGVGRAS